MSLLRRAPRELHNAANASESDRLANQIREIDKKIQELESREKSSRANIDGAAEAARTKPGERPQGGARRMKKVTSDLLKENSSIKKELAALKSKRARLVEKKKIVDIKQQYKSESVPNGGIKMGKVYTDEDIQEAKLKIYESCRAGVIDEDTKDELLEALAESVDEYNENVEAYLAQQEMMENAEAQLDFNAMKVFVYESAEAGLIDEDEKNYLLQYL